MELAFSHHRACRFTCDISSGDDNVVIKGDAKRIHAWDLTLHRGKGVAIGSLGESGSGREEEVSDVHFHNVKVSGSVHGARIKTWQGGAGRVRNITFHSFFLDHVSYGILIDQSYCPRSQRPEGCSNDGRAVSIEDVQFTSFTGTFLKEARRIVCTRCSGIEYKDLQMVHAGH